jgi:phosphate transport system permease protein
MQARSFGAAAVLLVLVLGLFVAARAVGGRGPGNLTSRQQARRAEQSRLDALRFVSRAAVTSGAGISAMGALFPWSSDGPPATQGPDAHATDLREVPSSDLAEKPDAGEPDAGEPPDQGDDEGRETS